MNLSGIRTELDRLRGQLAHAQQQYREEKEHLAEAKVRLQVVQQAQVFLQQAAQGVQTTAQKQVAQIVSRCLRAVFPEPYQLKIHFERRRGKTEAEFLYVDQQGNHVDPALTSGGVLDVASLALRLVSLMLTLPPLRRLLVLDEPFGHVSAENLPRMGRLLESLSQELGMQFVIVTHSPQLQIGKVIEVKS